MTGADTATGEMSRRRTFDAAIAVGMVALVGTIAWSIGSSGGERRSSVGVDGLASSTSVSRPVYTGPVPSATESDQVAVDPLDLSPGRAMPPVTSAVAPPSEPFSSMPPLSIPISIPVSIPIQAPPLVILVTEPKAPAVESATAPTEQVDPANPPGATVATTVDGSDDADEPSVPPLPPGAITPPVFPDPPQDPDADADSSRQQQADDDEQAARSLNDPGTAEG